LKLLHLCPDYPHTDIYRELIGAIDNCGYEQIVYIPIKKDSDKERRINRECKKTDFIYSKCFNNLDRLFYYHKVNRIFSDLESNINLKDIGLIHAHFLFSMGGVALKLKKRQGIDYVISVRNSDVNLFFKYGFWLRKFGLTIISEASKIVFVSPSYKRRVLGNYIPNERLQEIEDKSFVLPNGVNEFWLNNVSRVKRTPNENEIRLIYIGELTRNKNVKTCISVAMKLVDKGYKATLKIIGTGSAEKNLRKMASGKEGVVLFYGFQNDKNKMAELMSQSDIFIMPSLTETFGVVYIEAMTQGLPIIYTRAEGFDGFYKDGEIGYSVNPFDVNEIISRIEDIYANYDSISERCKIESYKFSWKKIAMDYANNIIKTWERGILG